MRAKARGYATVAEEDGINYREIADTMSELGYPMNHSSARNYVLRVMRKFAEAIIERWDLDVDEARLDEIIKNPSFQHGIAEVLQQAEEQRRARMNR